MKNVLLIMTGGTICSFRNENGEKASDTDRAKAVIIDKFRNGSCKFRSEDMVSFDVKSPLDTLSEDMTIDKLNCLIKSMKSYDYSKYDGVIILHGTDTLAYTSSLLSLLMAGIKIPVFLVSSQLSLDEEDANGNDNFKAAVELIFYGISPNVYVPYRNDSTVDGKAERKMFLHLGCHLEQCGDYSNNFYSKDMTQLSMECAQNEGELFNGSEKLLYSLPILSGGVVKIEPYTGLDYGIFNLDRIKAVVHGTYHSSTVCTSDDANINSSLLWFIQECEIRNPKIPVFIEPCNKLAYSYETTGKALRAGAKPISGMTGECSYIKVLLGVSLGYTGDKLEEFVNNDICGEHFL